jgi:hypothetical protein
MVMYHGSPYGGLSSFEGTRPPIYLTPHYHIARQYAIDQGLPAAQRDPGGLSRKVPTVYKVRISPRHIIDFRDADVQARYAALRSRCDQSLLGRCPPLDEEGFICSHTGLPMYSYARPLVKLWHEGGIEADAIWLDEGTQGISLALFEPSRAQILATEEVWHA